MELTSIERMSNLSILVFRVGENFAKSSSLSWSWANVVKCTFRTPTILLFFVQKRDTYSTVESRPEFLQTFFPESAFISPLLISGYFAHYHKLKGLISSRL